MNVARLKDIAQATGLSTTTVSIILNNKAPHISDATKKTVFETAKLMNYRPNNIARSLAMKNSRTVGLILPDISNPFFGDIAKEAFTEAEKHQYSLSLAHTNSNIEADMKYFDLQVSSHVDGIIIYLSPDPRDELIKEFIEKMAATPVPILLLDSMYDYNDMLSIGINYEEGAYLATKHLIKLGHTQIGLINGALSIQNCKKRFYGYTRALQEHSIMLLPDYIYEGNMRFHSGVEGAKALVARGVTALCAYNDMVAYGVYRGLTDCNLSVPGDLSVVGFDNLVYSTAMQVPLTTITHPAKLMGQKAVENIILQINGKLPDQQRHILYPVELVVRQSTAEHKAR